MSEFKCWLRDKYEIYAETLSHDELMRYIDVYLADDSRLLRCSLNHATQLAQHHANNAKILKLSTMALELVLSELLTACRREGGPSKQEIMRARGFLSGKCANTLEKK